MAVIDAVIMGAPDQVRRRKETISKVFALKYKDKVSKGQLSALAIATIALIQGIMYMDMYMYMSALSRTCTCIMFLVYS